LNRSASIPIACSMTTRESSADSSWLTFCSCASALRTSRSISAAIYRYRRAGSMATVTCPICGFIAETTNADRLRTVWADHLLGGCGDDVASLVVAMESIIQQRQELWRTGTTDEVRSLTETLELLWEALRHARLEERRA
jgi:hypothetical protein